MFIQIILIIVGFILLIKGADILVEGSSQIAKKLHISEIIIGLTIVSIGTSMPELFVSITSAIDGYSDMAIGNVIGSNLSNLLLILGLSAILRPVVFQKETRKYEIPMCLIFTIILMFFSNTSHTISRIESIILIVLFCLFIAYTIYMGKKESANEIVKIKEEEKENSILKNIILIVLGIIGLKVGGDFVVNNAVKVAQAGEKSMKELNANVESIVETAKSTKENMDTSLEKIAEMKQEVRALGKVMEFFICDIKA